MLLGSSFVVALVTDGGNNPGLVILKADTGDAGGLAQRRIAAVGANDHPCAVWAVVAESQACGEFICSKLAQCRRHALDLLMAAVCLECSGKHIVGDHMGKGLARFELAVEVEEDRPNRIERSRIGDHHRANGLRLGRDVVPDADCAQHAPRTCRDRRGAAVAAVFAEIGVTNGNGEFGAETGLEDGSQRETDDAAARDHDVPCPCRPHAVNSSWCKSRTLDKTTMSPWPDQAFSVRPGTFPCRRRLPIF
jgi:hypothetical protein